MATDKRQEQIEEIGVMAPVEIPEPLAPQEITKQERLEFQERAAGLVSELENASGSHELELVDRMATLGVQAQRTAGKELDLMRGRVGDMVVGGGPGAGLTKELAELRVALRQIEPHESGRQSPIHRLFGKMTQVRVLERIALRYEPVSKQVFQIESKLREGRSMLGRDNIELRMLYEQVESQQLSVQKNAYIGELVMQRLERLLERIEDTLKAERIRGALHDVSMRVQDLRTMETVHIQFFVSIEMSRQNNTRLGQAVDRTLALATNVVMVGLAIQSALARQHRVLEATQRTREFLGTVIVSNAAAIKQHTNEIGDVFNSPVIALDKTTQAQNDLIDALNTADRLKQEGIAAARENIAKLSQLSVGLQERVSGLLEQQALPERSLERSSIEA